MTHSRRFLGLATAALVVVAMGACANDANEPSAGPSSPAPTTTTPTPPSDSEVASEAASAVVRKYFATVDLVRQDPSRPANDLDAVASSTQLTAQKKLLKNQRDADLRQVGETKVVELSVESMNLASPATAVIDVCWDVSAVDVVDGSGKSVVTPERKEVGWTRLTVTNDKWETAPTDGWRVSGGSDLEQEPCAES